MKAVRLLKKESAKHGHHLVFGLSILSLALLVAWWSVFLNRSIERQRRLIRDNLSSSLDYFALLLNTGKHTRPRVGLFEKDQRFEIAACASTAEEFARSLQPHWPALCIKVRREVLAQIDDEFKRKKFMLVGESWLLVLLILLSSFLLYKFIQLEKRSTKEMEEFWGRVTHEIKTPITGIKALLQSLKNRSLDESQLLPSVEMALKQVEKQEQLAGNILAGSALKHKGLTLSPLPLDLHEFLARYFEGHTLYLCAERVDIDLGSSRGIKVTADANALRIILDNITDNAMKYCTPGLILSVAVSREERRAVVCISDNGPGFRPEAAEKIFEAYRCLESELPLTAHGTGMGLYISKELALAMNGDLGAESAGIGRGCTLKLFLPLARR